MMESIKKKLNGKWKKIRELVKGHWYTEARIEAKSACDPQEFGPCSECLAARDRICGHGVSTVKKFSGACVLESEDMALKYADQIIEWAEKA